MGFVIKLVSYFSSSIMAGRKKSNVWKYFKYYKESDVSVCEVIVSKSGEEERYCGKELKGMFASNLKKHIRVNHL